MWHLLSKFLLAALLFAAVISCTAERNTAPEKHYTLSGVVLGVNAKDQTANIQHGAIKGWMEGMTMDYPVRSKKELDQLHPGEHITATVNVKGTDYDLTDIHEQSSGK